MIGIIHTNLGTMNKNGITIITEKGKVELYFSYETLIAVDRVVSVNNWSNTTGKFLNELELDKNKRVEHKEVLKHAEKKLKELFLSPNEIILEDLKKC